jgi:hypothetical protein
MMGFGHWLWESRSERILKFQDPWIGRVGDINSNKAWKGKFGVADIFLGMKEYINCIYLCCLK